MKKIVYITKRFNQQQKEELMTSLPTDYILKTPTTLLNEEKKDVTIMLDVDQKLLNELLELPESKLNFIQLISTGIDYLPLDKLAEKNIILANGRGLQKNSVSETVLGMLLSYQRGILESSKQQEKHLWQHPKGQMTTMVNKKILITGTGIIPQQLAKILSLLGAEISGVNTTGHLVENFSATYSLENLPKAVKNQDIVINLLPGTPATDQIFTEEIFSLMKTGSIFVNVGRGNAVILKDLVAALDAGQLSFAALDVFPKEPLVNTSVLWTHPKILVTSHIAGLTEDLNDRFFDLAAENLQYYLENGLPKINLVSYDKGY